MKHPHVRRKKLPVESLDRLERYDSNSDDPCERDAFEAELSRIMESTETVLIDPRMNYQDLPKAGNFYEWITGKDFIGINAFSRQVDIGLQLNLDVCWRCSPEYYDGDDVNYKWHYTEYKKRFQLMRNGVCPACGAKRVTGVNKGYIYDKTNHSGLAGQRSSKCVSGTTYVITPDGPVFAKDFVEQTTRMVRLPHVDAYVNSHQTTKATLYRIHTNAGIYLDITNNHRMFTSEAGYASLKQKTLKVGMHFEMPRYKSEIQVIDETAQKSGYDYAINMSELIANKLQDSQYKSLEKHLTFIQSQSYSFKHGFFKAVAYLTYDISDYNYLTFVLKNRLLLHAIRMWFDYIGIDSYPLKDRDKSFYVDPSAYCKHYSESLHSKAGEEHYIKCYKPPRFMVPPTKLLRDAIEPLLRILEARQTVGGHVLWESTKVKEEVAILFALQAQHKKEGYIQEEKLHVVSEILTRWEELAWGDQGWYALRKLQSVVKQLLNTKFAKITKIEKLEKDTVYDISVPNHLWFIANGYHSHNSALTAYNVGYTTHRLLMTGDPADYYGLLPGSALTCIITAVTADNAQRNMYSYFMKMFTNAPWFQTFEEWCKEKEHQFGIEFFKVKETFTIFRFGGLAIRVLSPDKGHIRGSTTYSNAIDEYAYFDANNAKELKSNGVEVYQALTASMSTVVSAADIMREEGVNDVIFPVIHAMSSPASMNDPMVTMYKRQKDKHHALTYKIPTWKFNPRMSYEACERLASDSYEVFMRNFGCVITSNIGAFIEKPDALYELCDTHSNGARLSTRIYTSAKGSTYTVGEIHLRKRAPEGVVCGMSLDYSFNANGYTCCVFHIEHVNDDDDDEIDDENEVFTSDGKSRPNYDIDEDEEGEEDDEDEDLEDYIVVVDALVEIQPSKENPIHFSQNIKHVLYPLIEAFNVKLIVSDRWQIMQTQQDMEDDLNINHVMGYTPKKDDFLAFRQSVYAGAIILPRCEIDREEVEGLASPKEFEKYPIAHFIRQSVTVIEKPKTVEKGSVFSDDLFRVVVLADMVRRDEELRDEILSEAMDEDKVISVVATESSKVTERGDISHPMSYSGNDYFTNKKHTVVSTSSVVVGK